MIAAVHATIGLFITTILVCMASVCACALVSHKFQEQNRQTLLLSWLSRGAVESSLLLCQLANTLPFPLFDCCLRGGLVGWFAVIFVVVCWDNFVIMRGVCPTATAILSHFWMELSQSKHTIDSSILHLPLGVVVLSQKVSLDSQEPSAASIPVVGHEHLPCPCC